MSDRPLAYKWGFCPGRAERAPEESCHLFVRPQGRGGVCLLSLSSSVSLTLYLLYSFSVCSPGADLHFPTACFAPLSLAVQNKQAGVRGWSSSPRSPACLCVNPLAVASWGPQQPSQYVSWEWHGDSKLVWGERHSMCPSLGRDERLYHRDDAHHST